MIFAIDPGNSESGYVIYDEPDVVYREICDNEKLNFYLSQWCDAASRYSNWRVAIEMVACYGMPVGKDVFETCVWIGRFVETVKRAEMEPQLIYRKDVKMHLCETLRAKDSNIRQAIIDKFPASGGGKNQQVGTKLKPGPLYGIKSHMWSALAVALTAAEQQ